MKITFSKKSFGKFCSAFLCIASLFVASFGHVCPADERLPAKLHHQLQENWAAFAAKSLPVAGIVEVMRPGLLDRRSYVELVTIDETGGVLIHANFDAAGELKPPVSAWVANSVYLASLRSEDWQESFGIEEAGAASWSLINLVYRSNKSSAAIAAIEKSEGIFRSPNYALLGEAFRMRQRFPDDHKEVRVVEDSEDRLTLSWQWPSDAVSSPKEVFEVSLEPHRFHCVKSAVVTSYSNGGTRENSASYEFESSATESLPVIEAIFLKASGRKGSSALAESVRVNFELDCPAASVDPQTFTISHFGFPEPGAPRGSNRFVRGISAVFVVVLCIGGGFALKRHAQAATR